MEKVASIEKSIPAGTPLPPQALRASPPEDGAFGAPAPAQQSFIYLWLLDVRILLFRTCGERRKGLETLWCPHGPARAEPQSTGL